MSDDAASPAPKTVLLQHLLPAPIDRVWAFLAQAEKRKRWFAGGGEAEKGAFDLFSRHKSSTD